MQQKKAAEQHQQIQFKQRVIATIKDQRDALKQIVEGYPDLKKVTDLVSIDDAQGPGHGRQASRAGGGLDRAQALRGGQNHA